MNITEIPNTPEMMFRGVGVVLCIGIICFIIYLGYKLLNNG